MILCSHEVLPLPVKILNQKQKKFLYNSYLCIENFYKNLLNFPASKE